MRCRMLVVAAFPLVCGLTLSTDSGWAGEDAEQVAASRPGPPVDRARPAAGVSVRTFGAVGDGQTDDTAAIQRAADAGVGDIRFPRGVYRVSKPIVIDLDRVGPAAIVAHGPARVVMAGRGPALKFIGTHGGTADPRTVKENVWQRQRSPMVDGLEIVGAHPEAVGIAAVRTMQLTLTRVVIRRALHGVHLVERNRNVILSECHIYENRGVGVFLDGVNLHQINIANCHISYNGGGGIVCRGSEVRNLQIGTCDIEGNMAATGPPTANVLLDTTTGSVREGAIVGCTIQHTHTAPDSANIRLLGRGAHDPRKVGNFVIADNVLSDVAVNVHIRHGRGVVITGNTFWKGFACNLLVEGSSQIVVGPNLFDRNPDYKPPDSANGLLFRDCADCTLTGLHVNNVLRVPAGLLLQRCRRFNITNCTILNCDNCGLLLDEVEQVRVSDCLIHDTRAGGAASLALRLTAGRGNMIVNNLLAGRYEIPPRSAHTAGNYTGD